MYIFHNLVTICLYQDSGAPDRFTYNFSGICGPALGKWNKFDIKQVGKSQTSVTASSRFKVDVSSFDILLKD